jgi:uncharacterized protein YndB with AHSA1/START domain
MTSSLPYTLDRIITIAAPRPLVFDFLRTTERWAAWWGAGSTIDARAGGRVLIRHPGGVEMTGEVLEVDPPARIVFTYGYAAGGAIPPGGSRVTIVLDEVEAGTRLHLTHAFADEPVRDEHVQGWRFQLSLFANAVANVQHADSATPVDRWFAAWAEPDAAARRRALDAIAAPDVRVRDRFGHLNGLDDLQPHIAAAQRFMPGLRLERRGEPRQCQGVVLADWAAVGPDGAERGRGTNVFTFGPDGRIAAVTGIWT